MFSVRVAQLLSVRRRKHQNSMDEPNQFFRATILAREAVQRLQQEGHSAEAARRMVEAVINAAEFAVMKGRHSFSETRFVERLHQLPD